MATTPAGNNQIKVSDLVFETLTIIKDMDTKMNTLITRMDNMDNKMNALQEQISFMQKDIGERVNLVHLRTVASEPAPKPAKKTTVDQSVIPILSDNTTVNTQAIQAVSAGASPNIMNWFKQQCNQCNTDDDILKMCNKYFNAIQIQNITGYMKTLPIDVKNVARRKTDIGTYIWKTHVSKNAEMSDKIKADREAINKQLDNANRTPVKPE